MKIVFASGNLGKVREIREMLSCINIELVSLKDYPDIPEIVEDGKTFLENALKKARTVSERTAQAVLADDSGLQVDALGGEPGIYSARYAGEGASDDDNINLLLAKLKRFRRKKEPLPFAVFLYYTTPTAPTNLLNPGGRAGSLTTAAATTVSATTRFFTCRN